MIIAERPAADVARYAPLSDAVRRCEAAGTGLWPRGGGTLLAAASADVTTLEIAPFNDLIAHARDDMTVTVQAGMTVATLQALLASAGQHLPLDTPFADCTTVGGLIATGLSGPRRFSRGGVRDLLLGITVVGGGGEVFRGGGRVVKNVAGYDLCKLYTGSWGWLGAIVEATFRVTAAPETSAAVAFPVDDAGGAETYVTALLCGPQRPASIDLVNAIAAKQLGLGNSPLTLVIGFEGLREEVAAQLAALRAERDSPAERIATLDHAGYTSYCAAAVETALHALHAIRFSVSSAAVATHVSRISHQSPTTPIIAHAADGVIWAGFDAPQAAAARAACAEISATGGSWLRPREQLAPDSDLRMLGPPRPDWSLMRRVKSALDPANVFARGSPFDRALTSRNA